MNQIPRNTTAPVGYRRILPTFLVYVLVTVVHFAAISQSIGNWTFNNTLTGTAGLHNTVSAADFSAGITSRAFNGGTEYFGENGWPGAAVNNLMYLSFTITPQTGYQLDISSLVLRLRRSNTGSPAGSGPTGWALRSNLDGFAADIAAGSMDHNYSNYSITPGAAFTNVYTPITFRLYGFNASVGAGGNSRLVIDNITVNGIGYLLPCVLGQPMAIVNNNTANISCSIYNTNAGDVYFLERSSDGRIFSALQEQKEDAAASEKTVYFKDVLFEESADLFYYRIRRVSNTGTVLYSMLVSARTTRPGNPLSVTLKGNQLQLKGGAPAGTYRLKLFRMNGRLVAEAHYVAGSAVQNIIITTGLLQTGLYVLQVSHGTEGSTSRLIAVQ